MHRNLVLLTVGSISLALSLSPILCVLRLLPWQQIAPCEVKEELWLELGECSSAENAEV